jgi:hypothetical protein
VLETFGNGILLYQNGYKCLSIKETLFIVVNIFESLLFLVLRVFDLGDFLLVNFLSFEKIIYYKNIIYFINNFFYKLLINY